MYEMEIVNDDAFGDSADIDEIIENAGNEDQENDLNENQENDANENDSENETGKTVTPKIRRIQNPRPKLDPERLRGPRGIGTMENFFKDMKYRGKGNEVEDLNVVMKKLEHWCHRLFPKYQFDDCLERIEQLGSKKLVQTYVKKIRLDMIEPELPVQPIEDDDDDIDNVGPTADAFDQLLSESISVVTPTLTPKPINTELTEEQRLRMLQNRKIAEERRLAKYKAQQETATKLADETHHPLPQSLRTENQSQDITSLPDNTGINTVVDKTEQPCVNQISITVMNDENEMEFPDNQNDSH